MSAPRWARSLLRIVASPHRRDDVLGDMEEVHRRRVARRGRRIAALLTGLEALEVALALLLARVRRRVPPPQTPAEAAAEGALQGAGVSWLDFKLGFRMLVRYPGLTVVGGLSMALAIGIGAAGFEAIRQVVDPALPFPDGHRIVAVRTWDQAAHRRGATFGRDLATWRDALASVTNLGGFRVVERNLITAQGESAPLELAEISASAFAITGATPLLGRVIGDADERVGAPLVLVIGEDVWASRFGRDPDVIGRTVHLGSSPATIVGVAPAHFRFPMGQSAWAPLPAELTRHDWGEGPAIEVFGRLAPGVSVEAARAELEALGDRMAAELPDTHGHRQPQIGPYALMHLPVHCSGMSVTRCLSFIRFGLYSSNILFVAFLALIFANVALLMFARAATREAEIVVRTALGASRGRITAQLVAEALALGGVAALVGLWVAGLALRIARDMLDYVGQIPFWWEASLSPASIVYAVGLTLLGATVAGVMPALKVTRGRRVPLGRTSAGSGSLRFGGGWTAVIVGQVALTVFAVAMTAYVLQLAARIASFDLGIPGEEYLSVRLERDDSIPGDLYGALGRRLAAEPEVRGVAFASRLPGSYHGRVRIEVDGIPGPRSVQPAWVDPAFFDALGIRAVAGRLLGSVDVESGQRVVVVNEEFVQRILSGRNPVGGRVRFQVSEDPVEPWGPWHEIVGVVEQVAMTADPEMPPAGVYRPLTRGGIRSVYMAVHLAADAISFTPRLRRIAFALDPALRLERPRTLFGDRDGEASWLGTWVRILLGGSLLVLGLSLAGVYSIMSFTVSRRTREIGIRIALGADRRRIVAPIFARPLAQVALGVGVGVGSLVLLGIASGNRLTWGIGILVLAFTAVMLGVWLLACVVPTRRALSIEPTEALKMDG